MASYTNPYGASGLIAAGPKQNAINSMSDLVGKRIAVVRGNMQQSRLTPRTLKGSVIVRFDDLVGTSNPFSNGNAGRLHNVFAKNYMPRVDNHVMSKRTLLYAAYARIDNQYTDRLPMIYT